MKKFVIGVDEAGRGPLAGPVAVGVVLAPANFNIKKHFPGVADSKKLSPQKREEIYELLREKARRGNPPAGGPKSPLRYIVVFASAKMIDKVGITKAVRQCVWKGIRNLSPKTVGVRILLDGLLIAPPEYKQKTIIRGDASEPIISLASIAAKVERDRLMCTYAKKFPEYSFEIHKGYGTKKHYEAIKKCGLCELHRKTFL